VSEGEVVDQGPRATHRDKCRWTQGGQLFGKPGGERGPDAGVHHHHGAVGRGHLVDRITTDFAAKSVYLLDLPVGTKLVENIVEKAQHGDTRNITRLMESGCFEDAGFAEIVFEKGYVRGKVHVVILSLGGALRPG